MIKFVSRALALALAVATPTCVAAQAAPDPRLSVLDPSYYLGKYADLRAAFGTEAAPARSHWLTSGINECRQSSAEFSIGDYLGRYPDLQNAFGANCAAALSHWLISGKAEGRSALPVTRARALPVAPLPPPLAALPPADCPVAGAPGLSFDVPQPVNTAFGEVQEATSVAVSFTAFTVTCSYTGAVQSFTFPANAASGSLVVEAAGAAGGDSMIGGCCDSIHKTLIPGGRGLGAIVSVNMDVAPGTQLQVRVGGQGVRPDVEKNPAAGGWNGGAKGAAAYMGHYWGAGGGGATDLRVAPFGDASRILVAGGGGGAGGDGPPCSGGGSGGTIGGDGKNSCRHGEDGARNNYHSGGYGGTQVGPGAGGVRDPYFNQGVAGGAGSGPNGGTQPDSPPGQLGGGGGGGGLFGGGSGNDTGAGGGGGSSRAPSSAQIQAGVRDGNGQMILRYRVTTRRMECIGDDVSPPKAAVLNETLAWCRDLR